MSRIANQIASDISNLTDTKTSTVYNPSHDDYVTVNDYESLIDDIANHLKTDSRIHYLFTIDDMYLIYKNFKNNSYIIIEMYDDEVYGGDYFEFRYVYCETLDRFAQIIKLY